MPSSYNSLGTEIMVTGEKSGQWGTITNTNWNIMQMAVAGYTTQVVADGTTTALAITDGSVVAADNIARNMIIKLTSSGALTGTSTVTVPDSVEKLYLVNNATTGSQTITFKTASGTGVNFTTTGYKLLFSDGTNVVDTAFGVATTPDGSNTQIQFNNSGAFGASANLVWDGTNVLIDAEGGLRLGDAAGSAYVGLQAPTTITSDTAYTLKLPVATGNADQILVTAWIRKSIFYG